MARSVAGWSFALTTEPKHCSQLSRETADTHKKVLNGLGIKHGTHEPDFEFWIETVEVVLIMKSKLVAETSGQKTFVVVLEPGEEAFARLTTFATEQGITAASLTAIGAFEKAVVGWFDVQSKSYRRIPVPEQCEVLSAIGDIAVDDSGKSSLHVHAVLGLGDGSTRGGHLLEGFVQPTLEVTVLESPGYLRRRKRSELGIALIDLET